MYNNKLLCQEHKVNYRTFHLYWLSHYVTATTYYLGLVSLLVYTWFKYIYLTKYSARMMYSATVDIKLYLLLCSGWHHAVGGIHWIEKFLFVIFTGIIVPQFCFLLAVCFSSPVFFSRMCLSVDMPFFFSSRNGLQKRLLTNFKIITSRNLWKCPKKGMLLLTRYGINQCMWFNLTSVLIVHSCNINNDWKILGFKAFLYHYLIFHSITINHRPFEWLLWKCLEYHTNIELYRMIINHI